MIPKAPKISIILDAIDNPLSAQSRIPERAL